MNISEKTLKTVETAKKKEPLIRGYRSNQIERDYSLLINGETVEVGYRTSCGKKCTTHKVYEEWLKVIKSLKKDGFTITEEDVLHPNKSPTMAHGYWNSVLFSIKHINK